MHKSTKVIPVGRTEIFFCPPLTREGGGGGEGGGGDIGTQIYEVALHCS